jgi:hypothetical protein
MKEGWSVSVVEPQRLGDLSITIDNERFLIDREPVSALVFRAASNAAFSASFPDDDQAFSDAETRAIWLAALHLPGLTSFNRLDAISWFETEHWSVWRRQLSHRGVTLARCECGDCGVPRPRMWLPFTASAPQPDPGAAIARAAGSARFEQQSFGHHVIACGQIIAGPGGDSVDAAMRALEACGVSVARLATDEHGDIAWVDTMIADISDDEADLVVGAMVRHITQNGA